MIQMTFFTLSHLCPAGVLSCRWIPALRLWVLTTSCCKILDDTCHKNSSLYPGFGLYYRLGNYLKVLVTLIAYCSFFCTSSLWSVPSCWHCHNSCCVSGGVWLCLMLKGTWLDFINCWVAASVVPFQLLTPLKQKLSCLSYLESAQPAGVHMQEGILPAWGRLEICATPVNLDIASQTPKSRKYNKQKPFPYRRHNRLKSVLIFYFYCIS